MPAGAVGSWGPDVAAYARTILGFELDLWQRRVLNRALATDEAGRLVHTIYLASAARQQGKTALVRALIGWALTNRAGPPWELVLGLAHQREQARIPYAAVASDLEPIARRVGPVGRHGLNVTRYLGIRSAMYGRRREYQIGSRDARDAIRGLSVDLGIFDEIRTQRDGDTWAALEPTTTARPQPLILGISTAGDDRSVLLRDWWERGKRIIDRAEPAAGFGMTWYAPPDGMAPDDPAAWYAANPAIAEGRLEPRSIKASLYTLTPAAFAQERLNLFTEGADEWLPAGTWAARTAPRPGDAVRVVLGVEAVPSWRRVSVLVAIATDAGAWIGVAGELDSSRSSESSVNPRALGDLLGRLIRDWTPAGLAYSAAAAAAPYAESAAAAARIPAIPLGPRQIRAASAMFRSELIGARLTHADDALLAQQVRAARPSSAIEAGDWYFSIRDSIGEVDAIRAGAWATWAALAPEAATTAPQVFL